MMNSRDRKGDRKFVVVSDVDASESWSSSDEDYYVDNLVVDSNLLSVSKDEIVVRSKVTTCVVDPKPYLGDLAEKQGKKKKVRQIMAEKKVRCDL